MKCTCISLNHQKKKSFSHYVIDSIALKYSDTAFRRDLVVLLSSDLNCLIEMAFKFPTYYGEFKLYVLILLIEKRPISNFYFYFGKFCDLRNFHIFPPYKCNIPTMPTSF